MVRLHSKRSLMNRMEDSITDGPQSDDEQIIPEPEFERDTSLVDTLTDIARLSDQTDRLDNLYTGLTEGCYQRRQAE